MPSQLERRHEEDVAGRSRVDLDPRVPRIERRGGLAEDAERRLADQPALPRLVGVIDIRQPPANGAEAQYQTANHNYGKSGAEFEPAVGAATAAE